MEIKTTLLVIGIAAACVWCQDFQCPRDENLQCLNGTYPNPEDCGSYYECIFCQALQTNCPASWHYNMVSEQCEPPEMARCSADYIDGTLFSVTTEENIEGPVDPVEFTSVFINDVNPFDPQSSTTIANEDGTYLFHISVGIDANSSMFFDLSGLSISAGVYSDGTRHGVDVQSRDIMVSLNKNARLRTTLGIGSKSYSDAYRSTLWSGFRLEDFMEDLTAFSATRSTVATDNYIVFDNVLVDTNGAFSTDTGLYTAPDDGIYFLSFASQVRSDSRLQCYFESNTQGRISELYRTWRFENDSFVDTISKSILVELVSGEEVGVSVGGGMAVADNDNSLMFSGFKYNLNNTNGSAWAVSRRDSADLPSDPLTFQFMDINDDMLYNEETDVVTVSVSGFYYVTYTTGTSLNNGITLRLVHNNGTADTGVIATYRPQNIGEYLLNIDTLSRSVILEMRAGDTLRLVLEEGSLYSTSGKLATFCGFLLKATDPLNFFV